MKKLLFAIITAFGTAITYDEDGETKNATGQDAACKALFDAQFTTNSNLTGIQLYGEPNMHKVEFQFGSASNTTVVYADENGEPQPVPDAVAAAQASINAWLAA